MTFYYAADVYRCRCANRAEFVDVDDERKIATFYCELCLLTLCPQMLIDGDVEIKTITWLGSCPPYEARPPQILLRSILYPATNN